MELKGRKRKDLAGIILPQITGLINSMRWMGTILNILKCLKYKIFDFKLIYYLHQSYQYFNLNIKNSKYLDIIYNLNSLGYQ